MTALLAAEAITKSYAGVRALSGVSFDLQRGEVHALVGENGAGKSTLIKIMTGAVAPDSGTLAVDGRLVHHVTPAVARGLGIAAIYQQPSLFPQLTVAENIAIAVEPRSAWRRIAWDARRRTAGEILRRVGADIDADRLVESLSMPEQQLVEIAKAVGTHARILIMDEPTASLSDREVERLFDVIARLRAEGAGIIYISHRLEEVLQLADRVTVLRDGRSIGTHPRDGLQKSTLVNLMIGRELSSLFARRPVAYGDVALELRAVSCREAGVHDVSFEVRRGEILGMGGLVGSGRTELARTVFGLTPADSGEVVVRGCAMRIASPRHAIDARIGYVPEDRQRHGVVPEMAISENVSLANLPAVCRSGIIDRARELEQAGHYIDGLRIKASSAAAGVQTLSGGNQQKVALARWLAIDPDILILDEPTQGVDVGSKSEIYDIVQEMTERGVAVVMISSELPELLAMSDRIAVMRAGTIAGIMSRGEATQANVLAMALGHSHANA